MLKLLVFDLDGTLADTRLDLAASVNAALGAAGIPPLPLETIIGFVGDGARNLLARSLAAAGVAQPRPEDLEAALSAFLAHYQEHCLLATAAYPGLDEALDRLSAYRMAVLTNKPAAPARAILEGLGLAGRFAHVFGGDNPYGQKPEPAALRKLMESEGARPEETVMIGDGVQDLRAARRAGTRFLGFLNGMAPPAALLAEGPEAIYADLAGLPPAIAALESRVAAASGGRP